MSDTFSNLIDDAAASMNEQIEKEVRGAWRAGYDYVHVYGDHPQKSLARGDLSETFTMTMYVLPTNQEQPPRPDTRQYRYTFDLDSVPDDVIREMIQQSAGIGYDATGENKA